MKDEEEEEGEQKRKSEGRRGAINRKVGEMHWEEVAKGLFNGGMHFIRAHWHILGGKKYTSIGRHYKLHLGAKFRKTMHHL